MRYHTWTKALVHSSNFKIQFEGPRKQEHQASGPGFESACYLPLNSGPSLGSCRQAQTILKDICVFSESTLGL